MDSTRRTSRLGGSKFLKSGLPLMTLAAMLAVSSAAISFGEGTVGESGSQRLPAAAQKRVVGRGRLTGTRELQQVVTWRTNNVAHLAIESTGRSPRSLWQAADPFPAIEVNSVQINDLDADGLPEIIGLWCQGASVGCRLRVFHWDRGARSFVELRPKGESASAGTIQVQRFRIEASAAHKRITVYKRALTGGAIVAGEFEVAGSEIVRVGGGTGVTTHAESGIEGQAVISPSRPGPIREGQSDSSPFQTTLVVFRASDGSEVTRVETGSDGRFRVAVPPGTYNVGPPLEPRRRLPRGGQETVTVVAGRFAQVKITFDSGMR